ncbi:putative membrane protein rhomboid-like [Gaiella occulta]|uniref:Putative membrane protein rhomboid-like n=1 Tax=Gaiella occulta TaxID=1002870 RepID=A0A7M2YYC5_9ACTN|nr:rhomboid family intramembrane serine protease [Gaiella occulta]RDI75086.1 putative membrane protein rhomboid-like [Gaiella occulta]
MSDTPHCYRHPDRETRVSCSECGRPICEDCMTFAPVGIRCPDHASVGAAAPGPVRTVRTVRRRAGAVAAPATTALVGINVLVYLITVAQGFGIDNPGGKLFSDWVLVGVLVDQGDWWRLVTAMFLHAGILHLAFNMLALYWLGSIVERALGTPRYLLLYFVSGIAGSAGALVFSSPLALTVGASGAIFGVMGALLILEYRATGSLAGQAMMLIVLNLAITFAVPGISKGGHLGGLLGGILATLAFEEGRRRRVPALGPVLVIAVGIASLAVAYLRVTGYTL